MSTSADHEARTRVADDIASTLFVDAGAGCGKTTALVERIRTLVLEGGVEARHIAAVTFTEKAGAELRDRLRESFEAVAEAFSEDDGPQSAAVRRARRATAALDQLDTAAIGTLHAFARRILAEHPIEAGVPPAFEVRDTIGSSVAFERQWEAVCQDLLDEESLAAQLSVALTLGVTIDNLRSLTGILAKNWDMIGPRVLAGDGDAAGSAGVRIDAYALAEEADSAAAHRADCTDTGDRLYGYLGGLSTVADELRATGGDVEHVIGVLQSIDRRYPNAGSKKNWPDVDAVRAARNAFTETAQDELTRLADAALRSITAFLAGRVRDDAHERVRSGELEYQDLLVAARRLLRDSPAARTALHGKYRRMLLDEFQDTDPIQIELATRIAGGAGASQEDWRDISVPEGRLFVVGDPKQSIYRFRRADIATYLDASDRLGECVTLSVNFRTTAPVIEWINGVFGELITPDDGVQPWYAPLTAHRDDRPSGPPVTVLGSQEFPQGTAAGELHAAEAADLAATITEAVAGGWQVRDRRTGCPRPARYEDIAVLIPTRTPLEGLEDALDAAGIPFHAEASSLVYATEEVRSLLMCASVAADPGDELAVVTALRTALFGCGDDELWRWRRDGGRFSVFGSAGAPPEAEGPVGEAMAYLRRLCGAARWMAPAELLTTIIRERRMFEVAACNGRPADVWRRLRFVVDQAREWSEASEGGVRDYLRWVAVQAENDERVSESVAGEMGLDAVRILTIHAAKGLEFPIVAMAGMPGETRARRGVRVAWPAAGGYEIAVRKGFGTACADEAELVEKAMDAAERTRLLYVAATRARDHLIVGLHRKAAKKMPASPTHAALLAAGGALGHGAFLRGADDDADGRGVLGRTGAGSAGADGAGTDSAGTDGAAVWPEPEDYAVWRERAERSRAASRVAAAVSASSLEGTGTAGARRADTGTSEEGTGQDAAADDGTADAGTADTGAGTTGPGPAGEYGTAPQKSSEPGCASEGRGGVAVGRAVHAVLQAVDFQDPAGLQAVVRAQCSAEGVDEYAEQVAATVRAALGSALLQDAAGCEQWRESFVGATCDDGTVVEGFIDLVYRDGDGRLIIVDYKTDDTTGGLEDKDAYYRPQLEAYVRALHQATGTDPAAYLLYVHPDGAVPRCIVR